MRARRAASTFGRRATDLRSGAASLNRPSVCVAILAAGESKRFGHGPKMLAVFRGQPLLQYAIDAACSSGATTCVLVLGADGAVIQAGIKPRRCAVVRNVQWRTGMASSIRCALRHRSEDDAMILLVGDQPRVTRADIDALMAEHAKYPRAIAALQAGTIWGTPALFPRSDYGALARLRGDRGAKTYAKTQERRLRFVRAADARAFHDVDIPADMKS